MYRVRRPDGYITYLTCTPEQLEEVWKPQGYRLVDDDQENSQGPDVEDEDASE